MLESYDCVQRNDGEVLDEILRDEDALVALYETIIEEIRKSADFTIAVRCVVHTLQLGVLKGLKLANTTVLINLCRAVVKELRKQKHINYLRGMKIEFILPRLDCATRWSATYMMVNDI